MTIDEKAKAYDEALERAKKYMAKGYDVLMPEIFPELRGLEDERIRKWLVDYFSSIKKTVWIHRDITCEQILEWLEKQKEQVTDESDKIAAAYQLGRSDERKQKEQKPAATINGEPIPTENHSVDIQLAEWSEEDEKTIDDAYYRLCEYAGSLIQKNHGKSSMIYGIAHKLKSLRPCPSWKPSDHQMNILKAVKEYVGRGSGYWGEGLGSLIEDLEKLM